MEPQNFSCHLHESRAPTFPVTGCEPFAETRSQHISRFVVNINYNTFSSKRLNDAVVFARCSVVIETPPGIAAGDEITHEACEN